jgi:hypothetical protein
MDVIFENILKEEINREIKYNKSDEKNTLIAIRSKNFIG